MVGGDPGIYERSFSIEHAYKSGVPGNVPGTTKGNATVRQRRQDDSGARHHRRAAPGVALAEGLNFFTEKILVREVEDVVGIFPTPEINGAPAL